MSRSPRTMVGLFAVLLSVWVVVYWCYRRPDPPIRFDELAAPPLETQPLAVLENNGAEPGGNTKTDREAGKANSPAAPVTPRTVVEKPKFTTYVVRSGDVSWEAISRRAYGDRKHWRAIAEANPFVSPSKLIVGQTKLNIPVDPTNVQGRLTTVMPEAVPAKKPDGRSAAAARTPAANPRTAAATNAPAAAAAKFTEYTVKEGDTLSAISKSVYGRTVLWEKIFEANSDKLSDPGKVKKGMVLKIPALD